MIVKQYIKDFEKLGFGMFVHFGLYSIIGEGEWVQNLRNIPAEEYQKLTKKFKVNKNWAHELVKNAKNAGCKYITLTTRHHDGFSLYDTCGLNDYDAPHSATGRDLVKEFVDECNKQGIVPFFYHTLIDWYNTDYDNDFKAYLKYLRDSVELLCKNYGKIGGLWFDGWWAKKDGSWEFDELCAVIRKYQPEAMIINNTGMGEEMGSVSYPEIDSVTYERGVPAHQNKDNVEKYIAGEVCEIFGEWWGYASGDLSYKPVGEMINRLIQCRKAKTNLLLNVGPMGNGMLCDIDKGYLQKIAQWTKLNDPSIRDVDTVQTYVDNDKDFMMYDNASKCYYLFVHDSNGENVTFELDDAVHSIHYLDDKLDIPFERNGNRYTFCKKRFLPGVNLLVRVAKITV